MLRLASNNHNPQQPAAATKLAAIVARAIMTDSAPASFFDEGVPDEQVKCDFYDGIWYFTNGQARRCEVR